MAVVEQVVRQRESRGTHADDEHALSRRLARHRPAHVERIPPRQKPVDLESPGQRQHILEHARFRLRNVDRVLFLVDARLHAIVADAVPRRRNQRIIDADHRQRAERPALRAQLVELGDLLLQRAARQRDAERRLLERGCTGIRGFLLMQARRA